MYNLNMTRDKGIILANKSEHIDAEIEAYCTEKVYKNFRVSVNERRFSAGETDITYRMIGHWDESNLLPEGLRENAGWRKFTLVERIWIQIIKHLREFGLSLDKIALARECIMEWNKKTDTYDMFEYYIFKSWKSTLDPYIIVIADGHADIATLPEIKSLQNMIGCRDMLLISLAAIIEELGVSVEEKRNLFNLPDDYIAILSEIQSGNDGDLKIKVKSGKIKEIETTSSIENPDLMKKIQKDVRDEGAYGTITTEMVGGVAKSMRVTKRKRF